MRIITLTSAGYLQMTRLLLASIRVQHPHVPITCHVIPTDWTDSCADVLKDLDVRVDVLDASDRPKLKSNLAWKLVALDRHVEPVVFVDSDMLVLRPLDRVFESVRQSGWFTVIEGATLADYYQGEIRSQVQFAAEPARTPSFNTGLLGFDPARFGHVIRTAKAWAHQIEEVWLGDQGLLNLSWHHHHGAMPSCGGHMYNGGWEPTGTFHLGQAVLHFSEPYSPGGNARRQDLMQYVSDRWPWGTILTPLSETDFWKSTQPHPWAWLNQCNQRRYRSDVRRIRELSLGISSLDGIVVDNAYQAFLLHPRIRAAIRSFWSRTANRFAELPIAASHYMRHGALVSRVRQEWQLASLSVMSLIR